MSRTTDDKVVDRVQKWYDTVTAGKVRWVRLRNNPLRKGEKVATTIPLTGARQVSMHPTPEELQTGPFVKTDPPTLEGLTIATNERLMLIDGAKILVEWPWEAIEHIHVGPGAQWVGVQDRNSDGYLTAFLRLQKTAGNFLAPSAVEVAAHLLTIEGSWYLWKGDLERWMAALPLRFTEPPA
jgi:hypothetical protein